MVRKERIGVVVSHKLQKTIIVAIQTRYSDPKYGKILVKTKRYMAHDEENCSQSGDIVLLEESSPFSRHKKWILKKIIKSYQN
jgi:small subunit ribosomal protein S17